jgi:hypothetical protein
LNDSVAVVEAWRQNVIQDYEDLSSPIAARGVIKTHLNNVFNWQKDKLLKDAIERLLTRSWSTTYWTLTQEQKDEYLSRMLDSKKTTIPCADIPSYGTARHPNGFSMKILLQQNPM